MDKIFINKLILDGIHGLTEKEKHLPQRFQLDIAVKMRSMACRADSVEDAIDYRVVKRIATRIVREESFFLLETIANKIADEILNTTSAVSAAVNIQKLDIWNNGIPGASIYREKLPEHIDLLDFNIEEVMDGISAHGGVSFPIIPEPRRTLLVNEALACQYQSQPEVLSGGKVIEQLSSVKEFPEDSSFCRLKDDFMEALLRKLSTFKIKDIFSESISFNDMSLQKYRKGSIGITPHKDGKSRINLICVFNLIGKAEFAICDNRSGANPKFLDTMPGNVILLRAPGFFHSTFQPFHFVRNITEERIVFGLRQKTEGA